MLRNTPAPPLTARTVWLTGLPSAGKTTVGRALVDRLRERGRPAELLDGDELRAALAPELGFTRADREENVRRIGFVANLLSRNGVTAVCSVISPYRSIRDELRTLHDGRFVEAWVSTPVDVCAERDVKGLYARQRAGEIRGLTGVDDPYEPPLRPEVVIPTHELTIDEAVEALWTFV
ncbi:MAG: sulfate adenylyltransferase [Acidimicrobiia bacterium]|jgi:adenylylsulfate kinase|nr:sulfate adenylyltransferase [Acidimicrobiia bacterium]